MIKIIGTISKALGVIIFAGMTLIPFMQSFVAYAGSTKLNEKKSVKTIEEVSNEYDSKQSLDSKHNERQKDDKSAINQKKVENKKESVLYKKMKQRKLSKKSLSKSKFFIHKKNNADDSSGTISPKTPILKTERDKDPPAIEPNGKTTAKQLGDDAVMSRIGQAIAKMVEEANTGQNLNAVDSKVDSKNEDICGLSIGIISYVILNSGRKVFEGGKLDNGCVVDSIKQKYIIMDCNGRKSRKTL